MCIVFALDKPVSLILLKEATSFFDADSIPPTISTFTAPVN
jgi:hypothetical protein